MTTRTDVLDQLSSARPVVLPASKYADLWDRIVAAPADERLAAGQAIRSPHRGRMRRRSFAALASAGVLIVGGGAALAAGVDPFSLISGQSPLRLFEGNPGWWNQDNQPNYNTPIVASSVTNVTSINVPHVGDFQFWAARTTDGRDCLALRGPDGLWAGTGDAERDYNFGGINPGCGVTEPETGGFRWDLNWIGPAVGAGNPDAANDVSIVVFGTVDLPGATTVTEVKTGVSGPVFDGRYFALVLPPHSTNGINFHLEALDAAGTVIGSPTSGG